MGVRHTIAGFLFQRILGHIVEIFGVDRLEVPVQFDHQRRFRWPSLRIFHLMTTLVKATAELSQQASRLRRSVSYQLLILVIKTTRCLHLTTPVQMCQMRVVMEIVELDKTRKGPSCDTSHRDHKSLATILLWAIFPQ